MMAKLMRNYGGYLLIGEWLLILGVVVIGLLVTCYSMSLSLALAFKLLETLFFDFCLFLLWLLLKQVVEYDN